MPKGTFFSEQLQMLDRRILILIFIYKHFCYATNKLFILNDCYWHPFLDKCSVKNKIEAQCYNWQILFWKINPIDILSDQLAQIQNVYDNYIRVILEVNPVVYNRAYSQTFLGLQPWLNEKLRTLLMSSTGQSNVDL